MAMRSIWILSCTSAANLAHFSECHRFVGSYPGIEFAGVN